MQIIGSEMDPLKDFLLRATLFIFVDGELKTPYLKNGQKSFNFTILDNTVYMVLLYY